MCLHICTQLCFSCRFCSCMSCIYMPDNGKATTIVKLTMYNVRNVIAHVRQSVCTTRQSQSCRAAIISGFVREFRLFGLHKPTPTDFYKIQIIFVFADAHYITGLVPRPPLSMRVHHFQSHTWCNICVAYRSRHFIA